VQTTITSLLQDSCAEESLPKAGLLNAALQSIVGTVRCTACTVTTAALQHVAVHAAAHVAPTTVLVGKNAS
jgi:hypothetical protein